MASVRGGPRGRFMHGGGGEGGGVGGGGGCIMLSKQCKSEGKNPSDCCM
jgi:hypothetical protein